MRSLDPTVLLLLVMTACGGERPLPAETESSDATAETSASTVTADPTDPTGPTGPTTDLEITTTDPTSSTSDGPTTGDPSTGEPACEIERVHRGDLLITDDTPPERLRCIVEVTGRLIVHDTQAMISFAALGSLRRVGDDVEIFNNAALVDLEGLRALERVDGVPHGELIIHANPALVDITGLRALERTDTVTLIDNDALATLVGLQGPITGIFEPHWTLGLVDNDALVDLQGLGAIEGFSGRLVIGDNAVLADISALAPALGPKLLEIAITGNPALADLQGLEPVISAGTVIIADNAGLLDLSGLDGLQEALPEGLVIEVNPQLLGLDGLNALTTATEVWLEGNPALTNVDALANLDEVSKLLRIGQCDGLGNDALVDLSGLSGLSTVGFLQINGNDALASLAGLPTLALGALQIFNNSALPTAAAAAYAQQVGLGDGADLCNNLGAPETCDCMVIMP